MRIVNDTPFPFVPLVGRVRPDSDTVTLIVKAGYALHPGQPAEALQAEEQPTPTGDEYVDDDPAKGLRYASDFVCFKPRADLLLVGRCHAPHGRPTERCSVTFGVGGHRRSLLVQGDGQWERKLGFSSPRPVEPFRSMDIGWSRAFGGPGFAWNPVGRGIAAEELAGGAVAVPLPNVQDPERLASKRRARPLPGCFAPVHPEWKPRCDKLGTYKGRYLKERWPWYPADFDWTFFNAASEEMQLQSYLRGDEELYFENLHAEVSKYRSRLPGDRIRCFLERQEPDSVRLEEVEMRVDTLWVDMEAERLVLIWRGVAAIESDEMEGIEGFAILREPLAEQPRSPEQCAAARQAVIDRAEELPPPPPRIVEDEAVEAAIAEEERRVRSALQEQGIDLDRLEQEQAARHDPKAEREFIEKTLKEQGFTDEDLEGVFPDAEELTAARLLERFAAGETFEDLRLDGLDLGGARLCGIVLRGARMRGVNLSQADLSGADLQGAVLDKVGLSGANLEGANLADAIAPRAPMAGVSLKGANLEGAALDGADLTGADLEGAHGGGVNLSGCRLDGANLARVELPASDFGGAGLAGARLTGAVLKESSFDSCTGERADFTKADLENARFGEARMHEACFREVHAPGSVWEAADLAGADFGRAQLTRGDLSRTDLTGASFELARARKCRFERADLRRAVFLKTDVFRGSFEKADLRGADLRGANLYEAELLGAVVERALLDGANVAATKLA